MASTEEVLKALQNANIATLAATEPEELVIDAETRTITVPSSERLFGVTGDMNIERKYFRCPKIVGDNIDLSTHQIFIAYVYTETESGSIFPSIGVAPYHCEDVEVDGEDITFSWKLTGNVFKNPGFILFKMYAKRTEADPNTVFNTTPAIGTVLATIPDGTEEIKEEYPDVIAQIFDRLDALESGGGTGGTTNYENLSNKPQLNGVTLEGNKTLDQVGVLAKNQGSNNSGKFLSVGSDGNVVPADAPSGGTVDPEQIKQAVNGYLEENPVSGMTEEQEQQLNQNTTDVADLKSTKVDKTGWSPNKYIGTDAFGNIVEKDAPNPNAEIAQAEGSNLTLQECISGSPESFKVTGLTVTEENKNEVAKQEDFDIIVNGTHTTFNPPLYALVKEGVTYADEADLIGKNINKKIRKLIFTGEEDFTYNQYYCDIYTIPDSADYHNGESMYDMLCGALCTHFKLMNYGSINAYINGYFGLNDSGNSINFGYTKDGENAATVEELKEYFREQYEAGTPVTVFYILRNEKTEFISGNNITLEEGTNIISNSYEYNMDVSYYKTKGNNIPTEDDGSIDIDSLKKDFVAKESNTDPENEWWDDFKNFMGRNPEISPVDEQMKSPLVSAGMVTAFADRWKTGQQGMSTKGTLSDSTFVQGGHVFEGWDTEKEWRFTVLIGKFLKGRCHIFSFKPNENGVEEFGIVTVGGDHEYDGMDFAQKYAQMWGNIIASAFSGPSNYGSQKYYGGISGTDKTKPSGAHLEITADFHSTAPKQARFNDCENGLVIPVLSSDPTVLNNGTIWYNSTDNKFKAVSNGEIIILNQISGDANVS